MLKAIIFDFDGVIIGNEEQNGQAAINVFRRHGANVDDHYYDRFIGSTKKQMVTTVIKELRFSMSVDELLAEVEAEKKAIQRTKGFKPSPGIKELLKNLYQHGYYTAITFSSPMTEDDKSILKSMEITKFLKKMISAPKEINPKPAPDLFSFALKELGIKAEEAMVVEDSEIGIDAAKAAGISCVGYNFFTKNQDLKNADVLLESFENIDYRFFKNVHSRSNGIPITIANTKHLIIAEMSVEDIEMMYEIYKDPEVRKYVPDIDEYMNYELEKLEAYIKNVYSFYGYGIWGVYSKPSKRLIGRCGLENQMVDGKEEITLSYLLDKEHWGLGYALESCKAVFEYAKNELDIKRIVAVIDKENARSIETAKHLNMLYEKEVEFQGKACDLYAITL